MNEHTPGPWTNNGGRIEAGGSFDEPSFKAVAMVGIINLQAMENTANARLIAAAPDLLAALNQAAAGLAVIANHEKRTHPGCADQNDINSVRGFALECFHQTRTAINKAGGETA